MVERDPLSSAQSVISNGGTGVAHRLLTLSIGQSPHADTRPICGHVQHVLPHEFLVRPGERPESLHLILEGWACRYVLLPDGRRQITELYLPGDLCDTDWLQGRIPGSPGVAMTALTTIAMSRTAVEMACEQDQRVRSSIWHDALEKMERRERWIVTLGRKTAVERIAHLFCDIVVRMRQVGLARGDRCALPLTQGDIADHTGLTPVHVNRVLQQLRKQGLIRLQHRELRIADFASLARLALFEEPVPRGDEEAPIGSFVRVQSSDSQPLRRRMAEGAHMETN